MVESFNLKSRKERDREQEIEMSKQALSGGQSALKIGNIVNKIIASQAASGLAPATSAAPFTMPGSSISAFAMPGQGASALSSVTTGGTSIGAVTPGMSSVGASTAAGLGSAGAGAAGGVGMAASGAAIGSVASTGAVAGLGGAAVLGSGGMGVAGGAMGAGIGTAGIGTAATATMGTAAAAAGKAALFAPVTMGLSLALAAVMIGLAIAAAKKAGAGGVGQGREFQANGSSTETYLPILVGRCRIGMNRIFMDTDPSDEDKLYIIGALGVGPIHRFKRIYFDDEVVATWNGKTKQWKYRDKYKKNVYIETRKGRTNNSAYKTIYDRFSSWSDKCQGKNVTSLMLQITNDPDLFPNGIPNITTRLLGSSEIYDPRDGSTGYSNNLALVALFYLRYKLAGIGVSDAMIDFESAAAEANYCDEVVGYDFVNPPQERLTVEVVDGRTPLTVNQIRYYKISYTTSAFAWELRGIGYDYTTHRIISSAVTKAATSEKGYMTIEADVPTTNKDQVDSIELLVSLNGVTYYTTQSIEYDSEDNDFGTSVTFIDNTPSNEVAVSANEVTSTTWQLTPAPNTPSLTSGDVVFTSITTKLDYYTGTSQAYYRYKYVYTQGSNTTTASSRSKAVKIKKGLRIVELSDWEIPDDKTIDGIKIYRTPAMPGKRSDLDDPITYPYKLCATITDLDVEYYLDSLPTASLTDTLPGVNTAISGQNRRYTCDGIIDTAVDVLDNFESIIFCGRLLTYFQGGKYRFLIRKPSIAEDIEITDDNTIGDYRVIMNGVDNTANIIRGEFYDIDTNDQPNWVSYPPRKYKNVYLAEDNNFENVKEVVFNFVVDRERARRLCKVLRDEARFALPVTITTMEDLSSVKIGSVIKVTLESMGWSQKLFWVIGMGINHNCTLQPILDQYVEEVYDEIDFGVDLSKTEIADTDLQSPTDWPDEVDIDSNAIVEEQFTDNYTSNWRIKVPFTDSESPYWNHSKVYLKRGDDAEFEYNQTISKDNAGVFYIYPIEYFTTYYFQVLSVSTLNVSQPMYSEGIDDAAENPTTIWSYSTTKAVPSFNDQGIELVGRGGNNGIAYGADFVFRWKPYAGVSGKQIASVDNRISDTSTENFVYYVQIGHDYPSNVVVGQVKINTSLAMSFYTKETVYRYTFADNLENSKSLFAGVLKKDASGTINWNEETYKVNTNIKNAQTYYDWYWGKAYSSIRVKVSVIDEFNQMSVESLAIPFSNPRPLMKNASGTLISLIDSLNQGGSILNTKSGAEVSFQHPDKEYDITHFYLKYFRIGVWFASTVYAVKDLILVGNKVYECYQAGTSGSTIPVELSSGNTGSIYTDGAGTLKWMDGESDITAAFEDTGDLLFTTKITSSTRINVANETALNTEMIMSLVNVNSSDDDVTNAYYCKEIKQLDPKYYYLIGVVPLDVFGKTVAVANYAWGWAKPGLTDDDDGNEIESPATPTFTGITANDILKEYVTTINNGGTTTRLTLKHNKNSETDIEKYEYLFVGISKSDALLVSELPTDAEIDAGIKTILGVNYEVMRYETSPATSGDTTYAQGHMRGAESGWTYWARVRAKNTSGLTSAWTAYNANTWISLAGDIQGVVMYSTTEAYSTTTLTVTALSETIKIEVAISDPPDDLWGVKFSVKESAFAGTTSDTAGKADRNSNKVAEIAAKAGKAVYYHSGVVGTNYHISIMPIDNSKNDATVEGVVTWVDADANPYTVNGIGHESLGTSFKKFKYAGSITSSAYNKLSWTNAQLKIKGQSGSPFTISAVTNTTITGTMVLYWIGSATTSFALVAYDDFYTDSAYDDALAIAWVEVNSDTSQKAVIIPMQGDDYSISSSMISTNAIAAGHVQAGSIDATKISVSSLSAISANMGTLSAGTIQLPASSSRIYVNGATPIMRISKVGYNAVTETNPDNLIFSSAYNYFKIVQSGSYAISLSAENVTAGTAGTDLITVGTISSGAINSPVFAFIKLGSWVVPLPYDLDAYYISNPLHREKWRLDYAGVDGGQVRFVRQLSNADSSDWTTNAWNFTVYWYIMGQTIGS